MTIPIASRIAGRIDLLAGLFGCGVKAKELEAPKKSSLSRIFSILLGAAMIGVTACSALTSFLSPPQPTLVSTVEPPAPTPTLESSATPIPPTITEQLYPLIINVIADPATISPGGTTVIRMEALSAAATPVKNVTVQIEVEVGIFSDTNDLKITGTTDSNGLFTAEWQCPPGVPFPSEYYFMIKASKAGFVENSQRILVSIR